MKALKLDIEIILYKMNEYGYFDLKSELYTLMNVRQILLGVLNGKPDIRFDINKYYEYMGSGERRRAWAH